MYWDGCNGVVLCTKSLGISSQYGPYSSTFGKELVTFLTRTRLIVSNPTSRGSLKAACGDGIRYKVVWRDSSKLTASQSQKPCLIDVYIFWVLAIRFLSQYVFEKTLSPSRYCTALYSIVGLFVCLFVLLASFYALLGFGLVTEAQRYNNSEFGRYCCNPRSSGGGSWRLLETGTDFRCWRWWSSASFVWIWKLLITNACRSPYLGAKCENDTVISVVKSAVCVSGGSRLVGWLWKVARFLMLDWDRYSTVKYMEVLYKVCRWRCVWNSELCVRVYDLSILARFVMGCMYLWKTWRLIKE